MAWSASSWSSMAKASLPCRWPTAPPSAHTRTIFSFHRNNFSKFSQNRKQNCSNYHADIASSYILFRIFCIFISNSALWFAQYNNSSANSFCKSSERFFLYLGGMALMIIGYLLFIIGSSWRVLIGFRGRRGCVDFDSAPCRVIARLFQESLIMAKTILAPSLSERIYSGTHGNESVAA